MDTVASDAVAVYIGRMVLRLRFVPGIEWREVADLPIVDGYGILLNSYAFRFVDTIECPNGYRSACVVDVVHDVSRNPAQRNWR